MNLFLEHQRDTAVATRDLHRLHHVPAGPVRAADVAHLALFAAHEAVQRLHTHTHTHTLLERRQTIPLMHLIEDP